MTIPRLQKFQIIVLMLLSAVTANGQTAGAGSSIIPYFDQNLITDFGYGKVTIADDSDVIFASERQLKGGRGLGTMHERWTAILGYLVPVERVAVLWLRGS